MGKANFKNSQFLLVMVAAAFIKQLKLKGSRRRRRLLMKKTTEQADDEETQEDRADEEPEEDEPDEVLVLNDPDRWPERRPVARRPTGSPDSDEMLGDDGYDD
ncbi:uncharacterized protein [Malus domestica]|uniref:uncharacterized protein n=1 Tax=Malus domestica TaxID=3750 RepID=UPI0039749EE2